MFRQTTGNLTGKVLKTSKKAFYQLQGWDPQTDWPTRSTLTELGLDHVAEELDLQGRLGHEE